MEGGLRSAKTDTPCFAGVLVNAMWDLCINGHCRAGTSGLLHSSKHHPSKSVAVFVVRRLHGFGGTASCPIL